MGKKRELEFYGHEIGRGGLLKGNRRENRYRETTRQANLKDWRRKILKGIGIASSGPRMLERSRDKMGEPTAVRAIEVVMIFVLKTWQC